MLCCVNFTVTAQHVAFGLERSAILQLTCPHFASFPFYSQTCSLTHAHTLTNEFTQLPLLLPIPISHLVLYSPALPCSAPPDSALSTLLRYTLRCAAPPRPAPPRPAPPRPAPPCFLNQAHVQAVCTGLLVPAHGEVQAEQADPAGSHRQSHERHAGEHLSCGNCRPSSHQPTVGQVTPIPAALPACHVTITVVIVDVVTLINTVSYVTTVIIVMVIIIVDIIIFGIQRTGWGSGPS